MFDDQRKSFRILAPLGHQQAVLRAGRRQYNVRVVDESLGGYAVACDKPVKAAVGDLLALRTPVGLHSVELVRVERFSDGIIMGLHRLGELKERPEQPVGLGWLALAAVTGMLLVVACKPYINSWKGRWELPNWTQIVSDSVRPGDRATAESRPSQADSAPARPNR